LEDFRATSVSDEPLSYKERSQTGSFHKGRCCPGGTRQGTPSGSVTCDESDIDEWVVCRMIQFTLPVAMAR